MGFVRCLDDTNTEKGIVVKEMIKKVREDRSGFTLAELLIVVAIVAVLVAIAVPVFTGSMQKAEDAVDTANKRSAQSEALTEYQLAKDDEKAGKLTQYFYYSDDGKEMNAADGATYGYKATITVDPSTKDVSIEVEGGKGDKFQKPTA